MMLSETTLASDDFLEDIETIKVIDELRSALCSLNSVSIERVQALSELRGDIGKRRLLSVSNCGTGDGIRIQPRLVELLVDYRPDVSWAGKPEEWKRKAMLVIMVTCRKELLRLYPKIAVCADADSQPFLEIEAADIGCTSNVRRRVCVRAFYQTPFQKISNWIINGRWMPNASERAVPGTWNPLAESYEAYLDHALEGHRVTLRRNHYILSLNNDFEIWRNRCPALAEALQTLSEWAYHQYLLPIPTEWLMMILICGLIYNERKLGFKGTNTIPPNRIASGPSDRSQGEGYDSYNCLRDCSGEEVFIRSLKTISRLDRKKALLLPLRDDQYTPHDPAKPLVEFEPDNYFDYTFVVSRCFSSRSQICSSYPTWFFAASFDPRGLLINCPHDKTVDRLISSAQASLKNLSSINRAPVFRADEVLAIICLKTPRALGKMKLSKELLRFKNIASNNTSWKKLIPSGLDDVTVLSEAINLRLKNLKHIVHQSDSELLYKASLPYPLTLLVMGGQSATRLSAELLPICNDLLGEDVIDQVCVSKASISEILKMLK